MAESIFKTKASVLRWLDENGYQIGKSQFYDDCKLGLLRPLKSGPNKGRYSLSAVEKYAKNNTRRSETGLIESDREAKAREEKAVFERDKEKVRLDREQFELGKAKGKYVRKEDFEMAIVARAVAFMAHLNHTVITSVADWIDLVDGDQKKAPDLVEAISEKIEQRMSDFASDAEFDVHLEANV